MVEADPKVVYKGNRDLSYLLKPSTRQSTYAFISYGVGDRDYRESRLMEVWRDGRYLWESLRKPTRFTLDRRSVYRPRHR